MPVNVYGAGTRALQSTHDTGADCLVVARYAIVGPAKLPRGAGSALIEWDNNTQKHEGALPPQAGYPCYFSGGKYGDVAVYLGGGKLAAIDRLPSGAYHVGSISPMTIAQRAAQVGGSYLGYTSEMFGESLIYTAPQTWAVPVLVGNPHKVIYKWVSAGKPYWALADDTVTGPNAFIETDSSDLVTHEWAPLYGNFHLITTAQANDYVTQYRAGTFAVATPVVTPPKQTPVTTIPPAVPPVTVPPAAAPIEPTVPASPTTSKPVAVAVTVGKEPGAISPAASTGVANAFTGFFKMIAELFASWRAGKK